jgi:predicted amidohydrolase
MGAKIVFAPAAWNEDDGSYWDIFVRARALENHVFFIGVNRVGLEKDLRLYGSSQIVDPRGNILAAGGKEEEIIVATIDLSEVEKAHITQPHLKDRRPEAYNLVSSKSNF